MMKRKRTSDEHQPEVSSEGKSQKQNSSQKQGENSNISPIVPCDSSNCSTAVKNDNLVSLGTNGISTKKPTIKADAAPMETNKKKRIIVVPIPANAKQGDVIYITDKQFYDAKKQIAFKVPSKKYYMSESYSKHSMQYIKVILPPIGSKISSENQIQRQLPEHAGNHVTQSPPSKITPRRGERIRMTPKEGEEKRYEREFRSKISIGPQYQVDPMQIPNPCDFNPSPPLAELCEQIWAPDMSYEMPQAVTDGTNYLLDALPPNQKQIMMEELYKSKYNVGSAMHTFSQRLCDLKAEGELPGEELPKEIESLFFKTIWETRKNVVAAAKTVQKNFKISTCSLLVHYYNRYKPSEDYSKLKEIKKGESDYCLVCDDGGVLICCDECSGTYHLDCLDPPLESIPEDKWYCPKCAQALAAKKVRADTRKLGRGKTASTDTMKGSKSSKSNVDPTWTYWGLNQT